MDELVSALDFMKTVYGIFGMTYHLERSTRPAKALGEPALWDVAEQAIAEALDEFAGPGNWKDNPGDGAARLPAAAALRFEVPLGRRRVVVENGVPGAHPPRGARLGRADVRHPHRALWRQVAVLALAAADRRRAGRARAL